jgi:probable O-glycosylation ligase (exosortase A-associated)
VRDVALLGFMLALLGLGIKRPFLFVLAFAYVDVLSPQRLTYRFLNQIPISLICFVLAAASWFVVDKKDGTSFTPRQILMTALLVYCGMTTMEADFPLEAAEKWAWVWKSLVFAIFLPLTLRTRLRIETLVLFMTLSVATIVILGGIKTVLSGGGYGVLNLIVTNNSGIYESSIIAMVAIAVIPLILFLLKHNSFYPSDKFSKTFAYCLIFACLMIPVGTQARTGLICAAILFILLLRHSQRRFVYIGAAALLAVISIPFLPASFTNRMNSITEYKADSSASTRLAVWKWTWDYAKDNPFGGGFEAYRQNEIHYETALSDKPGTQIATAGKVVQDEARAYHSSYFEMLGEQGYPGLALWLLIHLIGLFRMEMLQRRYRKRAREDGQWIGDLADALQKAHIVFLVGSLFVGVAFQSFIFMMVGIQIGLDHYAGQTAARASWRPMRKGGAAQSSKTPQPQGV